MSTRIDISKYLNSGLGKAMFALSSEATAKIEPKLFELVKTRASQINGCAFCINMHTQDARKQGETEQRLYLLNAWRESPLYTDRERAAFAWAEAVTKITNGDVPTKVYEAARKEFSEAELVDLTLAVNMINCYNRFNIAFRTTAGSYKVGQHAVHAN